VSYNNLYLYFENDNGGRLKTELYEKRDDFSNSKLPFISNKIPAAPVYGIYIFHTLF